MSQRKKKMTENLRTMIAMVVDRSGSMATIREDTIGGINTFLEEQKRDPEGTLFTYIQFDDAYEVVYDNVPVVEMPSITRETFVPRGSTALLDAMGKTINRMSSYIAAQPEDERPQKVALVIVTDGHENASREFNRSAVMELIKAKQENEDWQVIYLAANQNAIAEAARYGIRGTTAMNYTSGPLGVRNAYIICSNAVRDMKLGHKSDVKFSSHDRYCSTADSAAAQQQTQAQWTAAGVDVSEDSSGVKVTTTPILTGQDPVDIVNSTQVEEDESDSDQTP